MITEDDIRCKGDGDDGGCDHCDGACDNDNGNQPVFGGGTNIFSPNFNSMKKDTKNFIYPIVKVTWRDANMFHKERELKDALKNIVIDTVVTVGFLIGYNEKNPIISRDYMLGNKSVRSSIVIPIENVISIETLTQILAYDILQTVE